MVPLNRALIRLGCAILVWLTCTYWLPGKRDHLLQSDGDPNVTTKSSANDSRRSFFFSKGPFQAWTQTVSTHCIPIYVCFTCVLYSLARKPPTEQQYMLVAIETKSHVVNNAMQKNNLCKCRYFAKEIKL